MIALRSRRLVRTVAAAVIVAVWPLAGAADVRRFAVIIALDRTRPQQTMAIDDFRINETNTAIGGVQHFLLRQEDGVLTIPFETVSEIELLRPLGIRDNLALYDAKITLKSSDQRAQTGRVELSVLRGLQRGVPWHVLLALSRDKGAGLHKISFGDPLPPPEPK